MPNQSPTANQSNANNRPPSTYDLLTQLTTGPSSRDVASATLRSALKEQYPLLDIDPDLAVVATPRWHITAADMQPIEPLFESLTSILARQALSPEPVEYIDGEHFLTLNPSAQPPIHLPVKIDAIARLINELSSLLFSAFQEQQLEYWNTSNTGTGPRWKAFSNMLRKVWNVTECESWSEQECAMARTFFHYPDHATRAAQDPYKSRAYLIDIDTLSNNQTQHLGLSGTAVLIGEHEQRPLILMHSLADGYQRFDSLKQLEQILPAKLARPHPDLSLHWRLYEPPGNYFDSQASALIAMQIGVIGSLVESASPSSEDDVEPAPIFARILPGIEELSDHTLSSIRQIHERIPAWLADASDLDVSLYSRLLVDLAELHTHNHGRLFNDDIPPIRTYARQQLQSRIQAHREGASLVVEEIEVVIESPQVWGTFVVPGPNTITRRALIELALENLTGLPTGDARVLYKGRPAPEWLSYRYLKQVIEDLDIGMHYPALIKQKLLDDPQQSKSRQTLYAMHLRVQLPLLALQWKIQHKHGIDGQGARYVAAAMQVEPHERKVDGQEIVIRALGFIPTLRPGNGQDIVANMFVIGPQDHTRGPCLLYRPLLTPSLIQFPSRQNLLYAIKHDHDLRESVLAWLPEGARFNYAQYVFPYKLPSPWTVVRGLIESQTLLYMSGPIALSDEVLGNDTLHTLFTANANALVELATRQSVSNVQKRWASYRQAAWQIFSAVLPFFGRTLGIAAWIWQIMDDLQAIEQAQELDDPQASWAAEADLLLNLGMALVLHVALRHPPKQVEPLKRLPATPSMPVEEPVAPVREVVVAQQPNLSEPELQARHQGTLYTSGALNSLPTRLAATLDSFNVSRPAGLGAQNKTPGLHLHLYPLGEKWYAPVAERWFEVNVDSNDNVVIVDPNTPSRTGPLLQSNLAGQWFVDIRLRLRGGGFRNRRRAAQAEKPSRINDLKEKLNRFDSTENLRQSQISAAYAEIGTGAGPSTGERRESFIEKADERRAEYEVPIRQLRSLNIIDTVPNYQGYMIDYLNKQLLLTRSVIAERLEPFRALLSSTLAVIETEGAPDPREQASQAQTMSTLTVDMIQRLEYINTRFRQLENLGIEGAKVIQATMQALPNLALPDLKAYNITLQRYLCIKEGSGEAFVDARARLHEISEAADVHIQSLLEMASTISESSLDERIEALNSLLDQFAINDQRLLDLHAEHPEQVLREPLESLRQQIDEFARRAEQNLAQYLRERKALEPKPGTSKVAQTPKKKIIKTRFDGVVVGEPRETQSDLVDVKEPLTGKVLATFHEKNPGVWVEREQQASTSRPQPAVDLGISINAGKSVLEGEPGATQRILSHSKKAGRIPVEIEEMFHQYAARLEQAVGTIEQALTQLNLTESDRPSAATLNKQLNDAAERLYEQGTQTRISMTKHQPPTAARVEWLHDKGLVEIARVVNRRRLKGPGKNYLDEYEVRDHQTHEVLWYAHFHYGSPQAALADYTAGHLKTREQQKLGGAFQATGTNDRDQIAIYRSEIRLPLASKLFFSV
ncbi:MAG: dermonecrotic toxin domain-containing protein [Pseudomonas proteolytica]|uniref:dermonecrotic toxin domain-containing protein n=1 Tax=Pseudomonas proteolytica TaxID=219574 RepID=UPI003F39071E